MKRLNLHTPRVAGLLALAVGAVALLALSGVAMAEGSHGDDHGHGHHRHHHHRSLQETGAISSFDATTGKLTIALPDGEAVTGVVTEETRIRCEGGDDRRFDRRDQGGGDNGGNEPGDDNGGQNEPGDDHGGDNSGSGPGPSGESGAGEPAPGEASCTVASLAPGAVVGEAELRLEGGVAAFTEIDLGIDS